MEVELSLDAEQSADVVVVGAGPGGLAAAVEAARAGASVLVLEATRRIGGNAAISTGYMAFVDIDRQHAANVEDADEIFVRDLLKEVELQRTWHDPIFDVALAEKFSRETRGAYGFLRDLGFRFGRFVLRPQQHSSTRLLTLDEPSQFRTVFERELEDKGVRTFLNTRALTLVVESGRVTGLLAQTAEGTNLSIRARSVILAAGGYQANPELRQQYQPEEDPLSPYQGLASCRGDGQLMAQSVGAPLVNMDMIPPIPRASSRLIEDCIAVNTEGKRFHDETGLYHERTIALRAQPGKVGFYICDASAATQHASLIQLMPRPPAVCQTIDDAANYIGCDRDVLAETVRGWNALDQGGATRDPEFGRVVFPENRTGIVALPLYVMPMVIGASFTAGGVRVTRSMEVLDGSGEVIVGLFAVGDCVGTVLAGAGLGGIHISSAVALGRVAGIAATTT